MTSISAATGASTGALAAAAQARVPAPAPQEPQAPQPSALVTVTGAPPAASMVYSRPAPAWASPPTDAVSALMAPNYGRGTQEGLAGQWRGLGGVLLSQLAASAASQPFSYRQTFVPQVDATQPLDGQLRGVQFGAATVNLQLQTRSGQTVKLQILVNNGGQGGAQGMSVEVSSTGALGDAERQALDSLSGGLDALLEGLGRADAPKLALTDLLGASSSVFSSLSLEVKNPKAGAALASFALQLGDKEKTLSLQGAVGQLSVRLDAASPLQSADAGQRQAAVAQLLRQVDTAASRGHADDRLVDLFKSGFAQMHGVAGTGEGAGRLLGPALADKVQPLLSGLADFDASFEGDFSRNNRFGAVTEKGHAAYQLGQRTEVKNVDAVRGNATVVQVQSERLDASYLQARFGGMLDPDSGNYDRYEIHDSSTSTTLIEARDGQLLSARQLVERSKLEIFEKLVNHKVEERRETPGNERFIDELLKTAPTAADSATAPRAAGPG